MVEKIILMRLSKLQNWGLDMDAYLFNVLKYIGRSGKKDDNPPIQDLKICGT